MIEINLVQQKKKLKVPIILGIDIRDINLKVLILAIILYQLPGPILNPYFEKDFPQYEESIKKFKKEIAKIRKFLKKNEALNIQLKNYQDQFERLKTRTNQIDKIIQLRMNPKKMLENVARSIPEDMWLNTLLVDGVEEKIEFSGESISYKSIGDFISFGNDSPYFSRSLSLADSKTVEKVIDGRKVRVQEYLIKGSYKGTTLK